MRDANLPTRGFVMRDANLPTAALSDGSDHGLQTLLLITNLGEAALAALVADAAAVAAVCTPAEADAILRHMAVDMVMLLDDVAPADRIRIRTRAGAATFVFGAPGAPEVAAAPEPVVGAWFAVAA